MRQMIHILGKDARHWRWQVAMLMAVLVARTVLLPRYNPFYLQGWELNRTIDTLDLLLPVVWWFLSAAVIHDESLVGDRQFWVTRPYSWRSLLVAKALFLTVFVLPPVLISDAFVLAAVRFSPRALLPRLLAFEVLKLMILVGAMILASITGGMRQFLLGCLLLVLFVAVVAQFPSPPAGQPGSWEFRLYLAVTIALLVWQYATRRAQVVRSIVAAGAVFSLISVVWPNCELAETGPPPRPDVGIRFDAARRPLDRRSGSDMSDRVEVNLPIELTGRERDLLNGALLDLRVEHQGQVWHPRWDWRTNLTRREDSDWLEIAFRPDDLRRLNHDRLNVRAEFGLWVYERRNDVSLRRNAGWQRIEGVGFARIQSDMGSVWVERRSAFHEPEQRLLYSMPLLWSEVVIRGESSGVYPPSPVEWHLAPVVTAATPLGSRDIGETSWTRKIEPGEKEPAPPDVTVRMLRPVALVKRTLTIEGVRLSDWVVKQ